MPKCAGRWSCPTCERACARKASRRTASTPRNSPPSSPTTCTAGDRPCAARGRRTNRQARRTTELLAAAVALRIDVRIPLGLVAQHATRRIERHVQQLVDADVLVAVAPDRGAVAVLVEDERRTVRRTDFLQRHAGAQVLEVGLGEEVAHLAHAIVGAEAHSI